MFSLKDKVALVTGASQGIGRATSLALAEAGAKVAIAARNTEKLASLAAEIAAAGGEALACSDGRGGRRASENRLPAIAREIRQARHPGQQRRHHSRHARAAHEARRLGRRTAHQPYRRAFVHLSKRWAPC